MENEKAKTNASTPATWQAWPRTFRALVETYFDERVFGVHPEQPANGNYMLAGLGRFVERWHALHGHHVLHADALDTAAAREIRYQKNRGRDFRRRAAALSACLESLAIERPERILDSSAVLTKRVEIRATKALQHEISKIGMLGGSIGNNTL